MKIIRNENEWTKWFRKVTEKNVMQADEFANDFPEDYPFGVIAFEWGRRFFCFVKLKDAQKLVDKNELAKFTNEQLSAELSRRYEVERKKRSEKLEQMYKKSDDNYCYECNSCGKKSTPREVGAYEVWSPCCDCGEPV